jgi:hypothetical protein
MTPLFERGSRGAATALFLLSIGVSAAAAQQAPAPPPPSETIEAEPIRCWWRTSAGAVRTGETFSLVLTCAVLENEAVQVVPDESRLGSAVVQMAPFDIAGGSHPADLHTANRRFFQYEYLLRMINPDFIGHDVPIPDLGLHFRVNSRMAGNASIQGRDFVYALPPMSIRVLNLVPGDAVDIRDSSDESFASIEELRFRASMLRIAGITLLAVGAIVLVLTLVRLVRRSTRKTARGAPVAAASSVIGAAARELTAVQRDSEQGWTPELAARALSASRIVAGYALGRPAAQQVLAAGVVPAEGSLTLPSRRRSTAVWSTVTAEDAAALVRRAGADEASREIVSSLQTALAAFTAAGFSRDGTLDRPSLDAALTGTIDAAREMKRRYAWPRLLLARLTRKGT